MTNACFRLFRGPSFAGSLLLLALVVGCSGGGSLPTGNFDPATMAESILDVLDADHDGSLAQAECTAAGLQSVFAVYDTSKDAHLSSDELAQSIAKWSGKMGLTNVEVIVIADGRPCPNVTVTLTPDTYLQDVVATAQGVTRSTGVAQMHATEIELPDGLSRQKLMYPGLYQVTLESPALKGAPLTTGVEVTGPATGQRRVEFRIAQGKLMGG